MVFSVLFLSSLLVQSCLAAVNGVDRVERRVWGARGARPRSPTVGSSGLRTVYPRASVVPSGWTQTGCFTDATNQRTLSSYSSSTSTNTITTCLNTCHAQGFSYGGVEFGQECYCGNSMTVSSSTGQPASAGDCSTACAGDSSQLCGGGNRIMVYSYSASTSAGTWNGLGCYVDTTSPRPLGAYSVSTSSNTPAWCQSMCQGLGYSLAGVEYGAQCFCANTITTGSGSGLATVTSDCSQACAGDSSKTCGGGNRIYIYQYTPSSSSTPATTSTTSTTSSTVTTTTSAVTTTSAAPPSTSTWASLGCYTDTNSRVLPSYSTSSDSLTTASCQNICSGLGYSYAGTEYSTQCYCSNSLASGSTTSTSCSSTCGGDSSQICGGSWAINVFHLTAATVTSTSSSLPPTTTSTSTTPSTTSTSVVTTTSTSTSSSTSTSISISTTPTTTSTSSTVSTTSTSTTSSAAPSTSAWVSLGCYTDQDSRVLASYTTSSNSNTPSWCQTTCSGQGYKYAGTEYGTQCWCSNTLSSTSTSSSCTSTCAGNSALICGGSWAINVYQFVVSSGTTSASSTSTTSSAVTTTTSLSTTTSTSTSVTTTSSTPPAVPTPSKVVVAHHMVGNTYQYTQATWASNIAVAQAGGIDGFALNVGNMDWEPARVADAYAAASGTGFKLFLSFDMTSLSCSSASDAMVLRNYMTTYTNHPAQLYYKGKQVVSTFSGDACQFGQGSLNAGWQYAVKTGVSASVAFIPSFFSATSSFSSNTVQDGDFNWNGAWPLTDNDVDFSTDSVHINAVSGKYYIASVSPAFFTHYGPNSYNKNWIYRSDDHLYNSRWELLYQNRAQIDIVEIISWNDYGESHYIGPMGAETDQPNSQAWVDGFDHTAWATMTKYYADAWRTGVWPTITKNKIYISTRPASKYATPSQYDSVGIPSNWQWTDDNIYCVVFSTGSYTLHLSIGSSSGTFPITAGVNKVKLAMAVGSPTASLVDSSGNTVLSFSPSFGVVSNPPSYNFNYYIQASP